MGKNGPLVEPCGLASHRAGALSFVHLKLSVNGGCQEVKYLGDLGKLVGQQ